MTKKKWRSKPTTSGNYTKKLTQKNWQANIFHYFYDILSLPSLTYFEGGDLVEVAEQLHEDGIVEGKVSREIDFKQRAQLSTCV